MIKYILSVFFKHWLLSIIISFFVISFFVSIWYLPHSWDDVWGNRKILIPLSLGLAVWFTSIRVFALNINDLSEIAIPYIISGLISIIAFNVYLEVLYEIETIYTLLISGFILILILIIFGLEEKERERIKILRQNG